MELAHHNHIMYCLNIHPGEHWPENFQAICRYSLKVKERVCPTAPFALGLRLSARSCRELRPELEKFKAFLNQNSLFVVSLNGFPYGQFHGRRIKEEVYLPDWSSPLRVAYTLDLIKILAALLPEGETGTISTVPASYGKEQKDTVIPHLLDVAEFLAHLEERTGKRILLALEPEPDCMLDYLDSVRNFFRQLFAAAPFTQKYLGVCLDTCHAVVEFESPLDWLEKLGEEGIQVPKIQISAALRAKDSSNPRRIFLPFSDEVYLHQTRVLAQEKILRFNDLPEALADNLPGEWRVHFHVPLTWSGNELSSTAQLIEDEFFRQAMSTGGRHFEIETYSFDVLPGPKPPVVDSLCMEIQWLIGKLIAL